MSLNAVPALRFVTIADLLCLVVSARGRHIRSMVTIGLSDTVPAGHVTFRQRVALQPQPDRVQLRSFQTPSPLRHATLVPQDRLPFALASSLNSRHSVPTSFTGTRR